MVIIIITYLFVSQRVVVARRYAERRYELEKMREKRELEAQEAELKYGVYKAKKQNVLCHKCGHRNKIKSTSRPLAVKCSQCDTRGVVY